MDEAQPIPYPDDAPRVENAVEEEPIEGSTVLDVCPDHLAFERYTNEENHRPSMCCNVQL